MRRHATLLAALLAAAPLSAQQPAGPSAAVPGDVIRLMVWRAPEFSGDFPIAPDGTILHPLLSEIRVAGASEPQVRAQIAEVLRRFETEPRFVFALLHRIAVTGEVRVPGLYPLPAETTIPQAVAAAGGPTPFAAVGRVRLYRGGQVTAIDLSDGGALTADLGIRPGDRLDVPREVSFLRDIIAPMASVVGAIGVLVTIVRN